MKPLKVTISKRTDGSAVLRCERADGSETWQKAEGHQARFFPLHDLTHFALEREMGYEQGFFGLIADGWDIADTTGKGARGPIPQETGNVELIVSLLASESASRVEWSAQEFQEQAALFAASREVEVTFELSDGQLDRIRAAVRDLHRRWSMVPLGGSLELELGSPR